MNHLENNVLNIKIEEEVIKEIRNIVEIFDKDKICLFKNNNDKPINTNNYIEALRCIFIVKYGFNVGSICFDTEYHLLIRLIRLQNFEFSYDIDDIVSFYYDVTLKYDPQINSFYNFIRIYKKTDLYNDFVETCKYILYNIEYSKYLYPKKENYFFQSYCFFIQLYKKLKSQNDYILINVCNFLDVYNVSYHTFMRYIKVLNYIFYKKYEIENFFIYNKENLTHNKEIKVKQYNFYKLIDLYISSSKLYKVFKVFVFIAIIIFIILI